MKQTILNIVTNAVAEINILLDNKVPLEITPDIKHCCLFGGAGVLDSLSLVSLIVTVEEKIENHFNRKIILANDKAMSSRNSPFLTIGSMTNFIEEMLLEDNIHA